MRTQYILPLTFALVLIASQAIAGSCTLRQVASMDMGIDESGAVYVPISINGTKVNMIVDTGGVSSLTPETVSALKLDTQQLDTLRMQVRLFGGKRITSQVVAPDVDFGGLRGRDITLLVMPAGVKFPAAIGGLVGPDLLWYHDVDFDMANAKLKLFAPDHCPGSVVYWTRDVSQIAVVPFTPDSFVVNDQLPKITVDVVIDGKPFEAIIDTGAYRSVLNYETAAAAFGWNGQTANLKEVGDKNSGEYRYPFSSLAMSGIEVRNPDVMVTKHFGWSSGVTMLLGMGVMRQLHFYISYHERKVYMTPAEAH